MRAAPIRADIDTELRVYVCEWFEELRHNGREVQRQFHEMMG
jgi:hypothetical protein